MKWLLHSISAGRHVAALALVAGLIVVGFSPASAHEPKSFEACAAYKKKAPSTKCYTNTTYTPYSFNKVFLRGEVKPKHSRYEARVLRQDPGSSAWHKVAEVPIGAQGKMKWTWRVKEADVDYGGPYRLKFKIPGHGKSNAVKTWVIYGE